MVRITCTRAVGALALAMGAGPTWLFAQPLSEAPGREQAPATAHDFRSCHWLTGREVVNEQGQGIAEVSDLLIDRGSGRIDYMVVKTGTVLGLGGRSVAVPYGAFRWNQTEQKPVLATTKEQLENLPEVTSEEWKLMKEPGTVERRSMLDERLTRTYPDSPDIYVDRLDREKKTRIEGEVTRVERLSADSPDEQVVVTVASPDGRTQRVILGPSWFVNTAPFTPMRGDRVVIDAFSLPRDDSSLAMKVHEGERTLVLRDAAGAPAWAVRSTNLDGQPPYNAYRRYVPVTSIRGMRIDCHGNECGKVDDVICERNSGNAAFISIDPNQNFLGIGDTKRLVPWTVSSVGSEGKLRIDASKEMVLNSPETPSDISLLNGGSQVEMTYSAFGVQQPRFTPQRPVTLSSGPDPWSEKGLITTSIERGSSKRFSGTVISSSEERFRSGIPSAYATRIRTDSGEEIILLGPSWYTSRQSLGFAPGDAVQFDAERVTIDGKKYWLARTVESKGRRTDFWDGGRPAWSRP